ncbi:MAG: hypothetical protein HRU19_23510 [Pseudobacteriovorax sp.]|nr:hypothetical protein [Pseudobacteriovorax sp.]
MKRFLLASIAVTLSSTTLAQNLVNRPGMVITNPINGISLNPSSNKILRAKIRELEATVEELQEQNEQLIQENQDLRERNNQLFLAIKNGTPIINPNDPSGGSLGGCGENRTPGEGEYLVDINQTPFGLLKVEISSSDLSSLSLDERGLGSVVCEDTEDNMSSCTLTMTRKSSE